MPDHRHKLPKETANRHFPEWDHGGKGSHARRYNLASNAAYQAGWDNIFGKDKHHGNNSGK